MKIISDVLLDKFRQKIQFSPLEAMNDLAEEEIAEYRETDWSQAFDFLLINVNSLQRKI